MLLEIHDLQIANYLDNLFCFIGCCALFLRGDVSFSLKKFGFFFEGMGIRGAFLGLLGFISFLFISKWRNMNEQNYN